MNWKICRISIVFGTLLIGTLIPICDASAAWRWRRARRSAATYNQNACCNQVQYGGNQYGGAYSQPAYGTGYSSANYGHVQTNCGCGPMVAAPTGAQVNNQFGYAYPVTGAQIRTIDAAGMNLHFNTTPGSAELNQPQLYPTPTDNLNQNLNDSRPHNNPVQTNELAPVLESATENR